VNNINFTVDGHTLDYDIKTSYMNAVRDTLASIYKEVEISSDYSAKSELIAIPYFSWTANSYNMGAEIITNSRIDILDGDTKQLIKSYHSKRTTYYSTPSPVLALNFLTGFSLFTLTPITMPIATDKMGAYGEGLLENTINESLSSIQSDLILDEKNTNAKIGTIGQESNSTDSSGSGFVVAPNMIITNFHVIDNCSKIRIKQRSLEVIGTLQATSQRDDLALLSVSSGLENSAPIRQNAELGEDIMLAGYPLSGLLSTDLIVTSGQVNSLAGIGNDPNLLQISAPLQPGNSGGPIIDRSGGVVGAVVSKLNVTRVAKFTGDLSQNVNFAIKPEIIRLFLDANQVHYVTTHLGARIEGTELAQRAKSFSAQILCTH
jgi:S1-C subfamily serine protease